MSAASDQISQWLFTPQEFAPEKSSGKRRHAREESGRGAAAVSG